MEEISRKRSLIGVLEITDPGTENDKTREESGLERPKWNPGILSRTTSPLQVLHIPFTYGSDGITVG